MDKNTEDSPLVHVDTATIKSTGENEIVSNNANVDINERSENPEEELGTHNEEATDIVEVQCDKTSIADHCNVTGKVPELCTLDEATEGQKTAKDSNSLDNVETSNSVVIESVIELPPATTGICDTTLTAEPNKNIIPDIVEVMDITDKGTNEVQLIEDQSAKKSSTGDANTAAPTGLGLLSQYESDADDNSNESETASVIEVPITVNKNYRSQVVEIDSDSSETISSDSESETEYLTKISKVIEKRIQNNDNEDEDDDDIDEDGEPRKGGRRQPPRVRGEMLLADLPPIQDLQISVPAEECIELGRVHSIVDQLLLVNALPNSILLDLDTVLFLDKGKRVLGEVFDVLGQVADPLYCVRFNTNQHIQEKGINVGDVVYVAPKTDYTQYVILSSLMKMRGSDASWENDIEPPPRYLDYSDDEEEREARQKLRKHRRQSIKEEEEDKEDVDDKDNDPMKRTRMNAIPDNNTDTQQQRYGRANVGKRRDNRRQERFAQHSAYSPRTYQPQHNTNSWHSHYNQEYQQRPPAHNYRAPYGAGPFQQQRPFYRNPSPRQNHYNNYVNHSMQMAAPPAYGLPPQIAPQMIASPQLHTMPQHSSGYVPNPFAFRSSTLPPQFSQPGSTTANQTPAEPAPPGAE
uniref:H/ACA ribonucleoprotein complex non-core subunit NAF1 n=1 Tax=Zeugodacus cucurbitae TaxID=28588 RepID=A0A0A1X898_ZEUCU